MPEPVAGAVDRAAADDDLARGRAAARRRRRRRSRCATRSPAHVPRLVRAVLLLRRDPRRPASRQLHRPAGPHRQPAGFRLHPGLPGGFVKGVIDLYHALQRDDRDLAVAAYESWGFGNLSHEMIDGAEPLGAPSSTARCSRTARAKIQETPSRRLRPRGHRDVHRRHPARWAASRRRANSSSWTAPRSASARCSSTSRPRSTGTGCSTS